MGYQIALAWNERCEKELIEMGFEKREVYMKPAPLVSLVPEGKTYSEAEKLLGDKQFFEMVSMPFQFVTTSYWGAGPE